MLDEGSEAAILQSRGRSVLGQSCAQLRAALLPMVLGQKGEGRNLSSTWQWHFGNGAPFLM